MNPFAMRGFFQEITLYKYSITVLNSADQAIRYLKLSQLSHMTGYGYLFMTWEGRCMTREK